MVRYKRPPACRVKKRVLQSIGSFHLGGSERQALALTRLLHDDGRVDVFAATLNREGVLLDEAESLGIGEIPEFPLTSFFDLNFVKQVRRCADHLRDNKIDIVHTHDFYTNIFGMAAASLAGVKVRIASKRETGGMRSGTQRLVERLAFGRSNAIVVNSVAVREYLINQSISANKIRVVYNGLDLSRFGMAGSRAEILSGFGHAADVRYITLVANLRHNVKNIPMLLRAARRIAEKFADVHFIIAGEGELEGELRAFAANLGVADRVNFIGRCTDVPSLLSISYACVLTSTAEGFSNSILEYMAAGRPVVATNVGGAAEAIVEGETGYLVASDDDAALAERLSILLTDRGLATAFGEKGKAIVGAKFSTAAQLEKTIGLYQELLDGNTK